MTDEEVRDVLENIVELAMILGWKSLIIQNRDGQLLGMSLGSEEYLNHKEGRDSQKETH